MPAPEEDTDVPVCQYPVVDGGPGGRKEPDPDGPPADEQDFLGPPDGPVPVDMDVGRDYVPFPPVDVGDLLGVFRGREERDPFPPVVVPADDDPDEAVSAVGFRGVDVFEEV